MTTKQKSRLRTTQTIENLLAIHAFMETYRKEKGINPGGRELVEQGLVSSTSVASHCFERMEELNMIKWVRVIARGATPLPFDDFAKEVRDFVSHDAKKAE